MIDINIFFIVLFIIAAFILIIYKKFKRSIIFFNTVKSNNNSIRYVIEYIDINIERIGSCMLNPSYINMDYEYYLIHNLADEFIRSNVYCLSKINYIRYTNINTLPPFDTDSCIYDNFKYICKKYFMNKIDDIIIYYLNFYMENINYNVIKTHIIFITFLRALFKRYIKESFENLYINKRLKDIFEKYYDDRMDDYEIYKSIIDNSVKFGY